MRKEQHSHKIKFLGQNSNNVKIEDEEVTEIIKLRENLLDITSKQTNDDKKNVLQNLAWILDFHKRENKPTWWKLFERLSLTDIDLHEDMDCLIGLKRTKKAAFLPSSRAKNYVYEYSFNQNQPFKGLYKNYYILGEEKIKELYS